MTKQQLDALRAAFGDDNELKKFLEGIAGTNERAQGLISRALEDDESAGVVEEVTEEEVTEEAVTPVLEIDDATIGLIATEVVRQLGETTLATVNGAIERQGKEIAKLTATVESLAGVQRKVSERVQALEQDEDEKRAVWVGDLPQRQRQVIAVTHRPRNERPVENVVKTSDDIAAATLAALPMPPGLKS